MAEEIKKGEVIVNDETTIEESTTMNDAVSNLDAVDTIQKEKKSEEKTETSTTPKEVRRNAPKADPTDKPNTDNGVTDETSTGTSNTTPDTGKGDSGEAIKDDAKPWDTKVPTTKEEIIDELYIHGGVAKNVAKALIDSLIAAKDPALREDYIRHISWHIATGGPTTKEDGSKGKAKHKADIIAALRNLK